LRKKQAGFSLIELLVTIMIFVIVMLAVLSLFDQGQWFYLHSSKKANAQEKVRGALEQLERDLRMAGFGVPTSSMFGGTTTWNPPIFIATPGRIYFRADIDNRHSYVSRDVVAASRTLDVQDAELLCPSPGTTQIILTNNLRKWQPLTCTDFDSVAGTIDVDADAVACEAKDCEVYTPDHVFYRLNPDANDDGVCDNTAPADYPFCDIQRAVKSGNDPTTNSAVAEADWETLATNILTFKLEYVGLVRATITARERSMEGPMKFQDITMRSEILVRGDVY
jgi:prepilin-type N-terminal cleavage/methylation domain-containing protein